MGGVAGEGVESERGLLTRAKLPLPTFPFSMVLAVVVIGELESLVLDKSPTAPEVGGVKDVDDDDELEPELPSPLLIQSLRKR